MDGCIDVPPATLRDAYCLGTVVAGARRGEAWGQEPLTRKTRLMRRALLAPVALMMSVAVSLRAVAMVKVLPLSN